jgi:hypothetical protein
MHPLGTNAFTATPFMFEGVAVRSAKPTKTMLKRLLVLSLLLGSVNNLSACASSFSERAYASQVRTTLPPAKIAQQQPTGYPQQHPAMNKIAITQPLSLQVWQNDPRLPMPGTQPGSDRHVGFASLSFTVENKTEQPITLRLLAIEVRAAGSQKPLMSLPVKDITLNPLEISPQRYQISNREGYGNVKQVEAVIVYQLEGKSYTLRSSPVTIRDIL